MSQRKVEQLALSGRVQLGPDTLLHEEVLGPQFAYELQHLLRWYVLIEKVLLIEYKRMGLIEHETFRAIGAILNQVRPEMLSAHPQVNMSDIAFALEQYVELCQGARSTGWHVDRSRNDLQACAQLLFARDQLFEVVEGLFVLAQAVHDLAGAHTETVMPGYTHYQAAQVISPAFYLTALIEQILKTLHGLLFVYDQINLCPLGAGAMAGQHLPWAREDMAHLLGFSGVQRHSLVAVASREWLSRIAGELFLFSGTLSRFVTDLMQWGSSAYKFIDLPDELAGISSAMPQKKNFPILERIRGKTAHIGAFYLDFLMGQRNTPYTNLVEVSKEGGSFALSLFTTMNSTVQLFITVIQHLRFQEKQMREACEQEFLGGFALANLLTLHCDIPYRTAQVVVGEYIVVAMKRQLNPWQIDSELLREICRQHGYSKNLPPALLANVRNIDQNLWSKVSSGSTNPHEVLQLLKSQREEMQDLRAEWMSRQQRTLEAYQMVETLVRNV